MAKLSRLCTVGALLLTPAFVIAGHPAAQAATGPPPVTVPAVQSWTPATGTYTFTSSSRVVVDSAFTSTLSTTAAVFAADMGDLIGRGPAVTTGARSSVQPGDIFLTIAPPHTAFGPEGYLMSIGSSVTIQGRTDAGDFNGTRTLLQILKPGRTASAGTIFDQPTYPERGLMVDVGRKFFSIGWLREQIREMAYLKLNYLHLHLSDNLGFRLESASHPEVVSAQHYSKQDIRDLVAFAARYHVMVVPEIDMPGHMDQILASHPNLKLTSSSGKVNNGFIDLSNPAAYRLLKDLITEYLPLFPAPYWHLGADEYVTDYQNYPQLLAYARSHYGSAATAKDTYYGFVNWAAGIVRSAGKTARMWNDGIGSGDGTVAVAADIVVEHWYDKGLTPQQLVDAGHLIMNSAYTPTYYVVGHNRKPDTVAMYQTWNPGTFHRGLTLSAATATRNLGAKLHVWCDSPNAETEEQVAGGIRDPLRVMAQQTWGSPLPTATYAAFQSLIPVVGRSPGWSYDTAPRDLPLNRPTTASTNRNNDAFPGDATDGSYGSGWSSGTGSAQWLQVDLGGRHPLTRVKLTWGPAYAKAYDVEVSADGTQWTVVASVTAGTGGTDDLTVAGSGRYLRVTATQAGTGSGYTLRELEAFGT